MRRRQKHGRAVSAWRRNDVKLRAVSRLLQGKRLEVEGKGGLVLYMGSTNEPRRDQFWYEHPGGRTYKNTPEEIVDVVIRHVGLDAVDRAKVHA